MSNQTYETYDERLKLVQEACDVILDTLDDKFPQNPQDAAGADILAMARVIALSTTRSAHRGPNAQISPGQLFEKFLAQKELDRKNREEEQAAEIERFRRAHDDRAKWGLNY